MFDRNIIRNEIESDLSGQRPTELLDLFCEKTECHEFRSWGEAAFFLHNKSVPTQIKDSMLLALFTTRGENPDPAWHAIFTFVFWPLLEAIFLQKCHWHPDVEELWHILYAIFLDGINRFRPEQRNSGIATKLFCDTLKRFHAACEREWKVQAREIQGDAANDRCFDGNGRNGEFVSADDRVDCGSIVKTIAALRKSGELSDDDVDLLNKTVIDGWKLSDYAVDKSISHEAAKKRRQRAVAVIRKSLTK